MGLSTNNLSVLSLVKVSSVVYKYNDIVLTILCRSALACFTLALMAITLRCCSCSRWLVSSCCRRRGGFRTRSPLAVIGRTLVTWMSKATPPGATFTPEETNPDSRISERISWFVRCSGLARYSLGAGNWCVCTVTWTVWTEYGKSGKIESLCSLSRWQLD